MRKGIEVVEKEEVEILKVELKDIKEILKLKEEIKEDWMNPIMGIPGKPRQK